MSEVQQRLARKAAAMARGPIWSDRPHDHLLPKAFPRIPQGKYVKVDD